jgi:glucoamylase
VIAPPRPAGQPFCDVDASFLDLVRFGVRPAADPRLASSLAAMDRHLRVVAPNAPAWRRYHGDVHGTPADAAGHAWPLLTGERGHLELALGHPGEAAHLLHAMERQAGPGGLLPEHEGGAAPHGWAHAEHAKLARSVADGRVFDLVTATGRVLARQPHRPARWCFQAPVRRVAAGRTLRIEAEAPAELRWSWDGWRTWGHAPLQPLAPGVWAWRSPGPLEPGSRLAFTFYWPEVGRWEGRNFEIVVPAAPKG